MNSTSHPVSGTDATEKHTTSTPYDGNVDGKPAHASFMNRFRTSRLVQRVLRALQFLSAFISLILFSIRLAKILRLTRRASASSGAVEGILVAAVLYTLVVMALQYLLRNKRGLASNALTWLLVALDIAFVGAFIAVADLTSPHHGGDSAACGKSDGRLNSTLHNYTGGRASCKLPWGTFALAIVSTFLHAATAIFHKIKDHHRQNQLDHESGSAAH